MAKDLCEGFGDLCRPLPGPFWEHHAFASNAPCPSRRVGGAGGGLTVCPPMSRRSKGAGHEDVGSAESTEGAISGMRSDCDLAIWISAREAAAAGVQFYRSANSVLLTEATIDPAFFHSIQILRSAEVLTANGGPPDPQQVALAIYRASASDTRSSEQYMTQGLLRRCHVRAGMCDILAMQDSIRRSNGPRQGSSMHPCPHPSGRLLR